MDLIAQKTAESVGLDLTRPDVAEFVWATVGLFVLALLLVALVRSAQRQQWGWFFACLAFAPLAAPLYFLSGAAAQPRRAQQSA